MWHIAKAVPLRISTQEAQRHFRKWDLPESLQNSVPVCRLCVLLVFQFCIVYTKWNQTFQIIIVNNVIKTNLPEVLQACFKFLTGKVFRNKCVMEHVLWCIGPEGEPVLY